MRIVSLSLAIALTAASLGGCSQLTTSPAAISTSAATLLDDVSAITIATCKFVPTAETVAGLATATSTSATAALGLASAIASAICSAVPASPKVALRRGAIHGVTLPDGTRGVTLPAVDGVQVAGYFVQ